MCSKHISVYSIFRQTAQYFIYTAIFPYIGILAVFMKQKFKFSKNYGYLIGPQKRLYDTNSGYIFTYLQKVQDYISLTIVPGSGKHSVRVVFSTVEALLPHVIFTSAWEVFAENKRVIYVTEFIVKFTWRLLNNFVIQSLVFIHSFFSFLF